MQTEVLSPGVAVEGIVSKPLLAEFIGIGIATAVDAVEVMIAFGSLYEIDVTVGCGGDCRCGTATYRTVVLAIYVVGWCGFFPDGGETLVVDGADLVDATQGAIRLRAAWVVM